MKTPTAAQWPKMGTRRLKRITLRSIHYKIHFFFSNSVSIKFKSTWRYFSAQCTNSPSSQLKNNLKCNLTIFETIFHRIKCNLVVYKLMFNSHFVPFCAISWMKNYEIYCSIRNGAYFDSTLCGY